jgi:hypothetical protein
MLYFTLTSLTLFSQAIFTQMAERLETTTGESRPANKSLGATIA